MAFFFAPYQIRGRPGRGARVALDLAGAARPGRVGAGRSSIFTFPSLPTSNLERLPRRLPARRPRDAARDRGGRASRVRRRARSSAAQPLRWIGLRSYSLYLWHYPIFCVTRPGPRRPAARLAAAGAACSCCVVRRGRALVPLRRDADPRRRDRPLPRAAADRARRAAPARSSARGILIVTALGGRRRSSLGASLAGAQGEHAAHPGLQRRAHAGDRGNVADKQTIDALRNAQRPPRRAGATGATGATGTGDGPTVDHRCTTPRHRARSRTRCSRSATRSCSAPQQSLERADPGHLRGREGEPAVLGRDRRARRSTRTKGCSRRRSSCTWARTARSATRSSTQLMAVVGPTAGVLHQRARAANVGDGSERPARGRRARSTRTRTCSTGTTSAARTPTGSSTDGIHLTRRRREGLRRVHPRPPASRQVRAAGASISGEPVEHPVADLQEPVAEVERERGAEQLEVPRDRRLPARRPDRVMPGMSPRSTVWPHRGHVPSGVTVGGVRNLLQCTHQATLPLDQVLGLAGNSRGSRGGLGPCLRQPPIRGACRSL